MKTGLFSSFPPTSLNNKIKLVQGLFTRHFVCSECYENFFTCSRWHVLRQFLTWKVFLDRLSSDELQKKIKGGQEKSRKLYDKPFLSTRVVVKRVVLTERVILRWIVLRTNLFTIISLFTMQTFIKLCQRQNSFLKLLKFECGDKNGKEPFLHSLLRLFFLSPPPTCKCLYLKLPFNLSDCHENWHVD